jgi:hypothetical protein
MDTYQISITFGRHHFYSVQSCETFKWDGKLEIDNGEVLSIYKLNYCKWNGVYFGPSREISSKLENPEWKSEIVQNSGEGLEGIRFTVMGEKTSRITIDLLPLKIEFTLGELLDKEFLEYHVGGKFSGQPVSIFLGPDSRIRITRKAYLSSIEKEKKSGWLIMPDDFSGEKINFCVKYCTIIDPKANESADFEIKNYELLKKENCDVKLQFLAAVKESENNYEVTNSWVEFEVQIGNYVQKVTIFY